MHELLAGAARDLAPAFQPRKTSERHPKGGGRS